MAILEGRWAWWNQNHATSFDLPRMVQRAKDAYLKGVIIKYGYPQVEQAFTAAGIPFAVERYVYPSQPEAEAQKLANTIDAGAVVAVINAEVEWESLGPEPMERLIAAFRARHPTVELYASVDTRGNRMGLPFMRVLAAHIAGWLSEVYPLAFREARPVGYVARAFADCLDGKDFGDIAILPTIQTYDGIGATAIAEQLAEVKRRQLPGCQAYTIAHATDAEWAEFAQEEGHMATYFTEAQKVGMIKMFVHLSPDLQPIAPETWAAAWRYVGATTPPPQPRVRRPDVDVESPDILIELGGRQIVTY